MIWIKAVLVGLVAAVLATVLVPIAILAWELIPTIGAVGSDGIGFVLVGTEIVLPAIIGFAFGFWWSVRRSRIKRALAG